MVNIAKKMSSLYKLQLCCSNEFKIVWSSSSITITTNSRNSNNNNSHKISVSSSLFFTITIKQISMQTLSCNCECQKMRFYICSIFAYLNVCRSLLDGESNEYWTMVEMSSTKLCVVVCFSTYFGIVSLIRLPARTLTLSLSLQLALLCYHRKSTETRYSKE